MTNGDHVATAMRMRALLHGHLVSRALTVVARLGIVELLTDGPLTAAELASRTGVDPASLRRLLGALAVFEVFDDLGDDKFGVTPLGATLHPECPGSTLPTALLLAQDFGEIWHDLAETVRDGGDAIQRRFGVGLFEHLQQNLELHDAFDRSQARGMELEAAEIFEYVRFDAGGTVVDIGGGDGSLLAEFLTRQPGRRGVLLDVPATADRALANLEKAGVADQAERSSRATSSRSGLSAERCTCCAMGEFNRSLQHRAAVVSVAAPRRPRPGSSSRGSCGVGY
ncbi:methyltransferase [Streptomyces sp. A30]|uniref:methyltransferase family protein n=1 Tax=Streptomyces sp. A30 TaxID=2789273 RepID=UPI00398140E3